MASEEEMKAAAAMAKDQEEKKKIVIEHISANCSESSPHQNLRKIAKALKDGDKLVCSVIAGGKTNFSYKVFLANAPVVKLFAKICFSYALWNPDRSVHYDVQRTQNEFDVMLKFSRLMGDGAPIAMPYLCLDIPPDMKLLVTQWSPADEQWSNQFIDGEVDHRVIPIFARAFATLNLCQDFDPNFNEDVRPCMDSMFPAAKKVFATIIAGPSQDKGTLLAREMGQDEFDKLMDKNVECYNKREALVHHDTHTFNLLVESKPSIEKLEKFGEKGVGVICDWEMTFAGPLAGDPGKTLFWPLCCSLCHALHGNKAAAYDILSVMEKFWDEYAAVMVETGKKDEEFLRETYRESLGWLCLMSYVALILFDLFQEELPLDGLSEEDKTKALASIAYVSLLIMRVGFGDDNGMSYDELKAFFRETVSNEIEELLQLSAGRRPGVRRASMLRASGRRVSDASLYDETARHLSMDPSARRGSVYDVGHAATLAELRLLAEKDDE